MNQNVARIGRQFRGIWDQLGVNQRVTVVVATAVLALGVAGISIWSGRTDYSLLYGKLSDGEAAKVIAALDDAKVPYRIGNGGGSVLIPSDKVHVVRMQLAGKGIPAVRASGSRSSTSRISASPISFSARTIFGHYRENWPGRLRRSMRLRAPGSWWSFPKTGS